MISPPHPRKLREREFRPNAVLSLSESNKKERKKKERRKSATCTVLCCRRSPSPSRLNRIERVRTKMVVVVVVIVTQPDFLLSRASVFSVTWAKSREQTLGQLSSCRRGWSKGTYSSNTFCSCCRFLFRKSLSFVNWRKPLKVPFCLIGFDMPITQFCSWYERKNAAVVQRCRPPLNLATEEMTWLHFHAKTTIKSLNATQNIVRPMPKVPSYTEYP